MEDIFDAADLLAIEQDAQSSSCSDSANGGASNEDWGSLDQEDDDCEKQSLFQQPQEVEGQTIHNSSTDVNVEDSDEDSDDGFLTSMLALGKKSAQDVTALEQEKIVQQESGRTDSSQHNFCGNDNVDEESLATSENVKILMGHSASRWITNYQTCKQKHPKKNVKEERSSHCIYDGVISIQNSSGDSIKDKPSELRLSVSNKRKRQSAVREVTEATLEQLDVAQKERKTLLHGQAELAPSAERSTLGTMVDCIARYDATKGSYILEIVDLDVSASTDNKTGKSKDDEMSPSMEHPRSTIADPRSRAKQAEKQVRKLKQGRGLRS